jgi:hypothetical protein
MAVLLRDCFVVRFLIQDRIIVYRFSVKGVWGTDKPTPLGVKTPLPRFAPALFVIFARPAYALTRSVQHEGREKKRWRPGIK